MPFDAMRKEGNNHNDNNTMRVLFCSLSPFKRQEIQQKKNKSFVQPFILVFRLNVSGLYGMVCHYSKSY